HQQNPDEHGKCGRRDETVAIAVAEDALRLVIDEAHQQFDERLAPPGRAGGRAARDPPQEAEADEAEQNGNGERVEVKGPETALAEHLRPVRQVVADVLSGVEFRGHRSTRNQSTRRARRTPWKTRAWRRRRRREARRSRRRRSSSARATAGSTRGPASPLRPSAQRPESPLRTSQPCPKPPVRTRPLQSGRSCRRRPPTPRLALPPETRPRRRLPSSPRSARREPCGSACSGAEAWRSLPPHPANPKNYNACRIALSAASLKARQGDRGSSSAARACRCPSFPSGSRPWCRAAPKFPPRGARDRGLPACAAARSRREAAAAPGPRCRAPTGLSPPRACRARSGARRRARAALARGPSRARLPSTSPAADAAA